MLCSIAVPAYADSYEYDALNRLKQVTYDNGNVVTYEYDAAGNIVTIQTVLGLDVNIIIAGAGSVTGEAVAGSTIKVLINNELVGETVANSDRTFSVNVANLQAGQSVRVQALKDGKVFADKGMQVMAAPTPPSGNNGGGSTGGGESTGGSTAPSESTPEPEKTEVELTPEVTIVEEDGEKSAVISLDNEEQLETVTGETITVKVEEDVQSVVTELNMTVVEQLIENDNKIQVETAKAQYTIPLHLVDFDTVVAQLDNATVKDVKLHVVISEAAAAQKQAIEALAQQQNFQLIVEPITFKMEAQAGQQTVEIREFSEFVQQKITMPSNVKVDASMTAVAISADGTIRHVPTKFVTENGKTYAVISTMANETYAIIQNKATFSDVNQHWAKGHIELAAAKMIISGVRPGEFEPNRNITRAEFATIMNRALGLPATASEKTFKDIQSSDWYYESVLTASKFGLISGYEDASFKPNASITREEAMAIIEKSLKLIQLELSLEDAELDALLAKFTDNQAVSPWAKRAIATNLKYGIVTGDSNHTLRAKDSIKRGEAITIIMKLLTTADFIQE